MKSRTVLKRLRAVAFPAALLAVALASFSLTRALLATADEAQAAPPPPQTPREERKRLSEENAARPKFAGELHGFTFYLPSSGFDLRAVARQRSAECTGTNARYVGEEQAAASHANFIAGYLPLGVQQTSVTLLACEDEVFNIQRNYGKKGVLITVLRALGPAVSLSKAPVERMEARTIGGRPAVIIRGVFPEQGTEIQMRDNSSHWILSGRGITLEELIKVAEGVR